VNLAKPLPCTFHRAFDEISDSISAIENIIECGFSRVLTSGGKNTAFEGKDAIAKLNEFAKNKIVLIPAGGIRSDNITEIARISNCFEFHSAAITDNSSFSDPQEIQSLSNYLSA
jgi:copper homeostasis protein